MQPTRVVRRAATAIIKTPKPTIPRIPGDNAGEEELLALPEVALSTVLVEVCPLHTSTTADEYPPAFSVPSKAFDVAPLLLVLLLLPPPPLEP